MLINTQDNYTLAPEFTEGVAKGNYPIVILTKSDGNSLVEMLDKYYTEVFARLDVEASAVELQQQQQQEQGEVETSTEGSIPSKKGKPNPIHMVCCADYILYMYLLLYISRVLYS